MMSKNIEKMKIGIKLELQDIPENVLLDENVIKKEFQDYFLLNNSLFNKEMEVFKLDFSNLK